MTQGVKKLEETIEDSKTKAIDFSRQKELSVWKLLIVVSPGVISLVMQLVERIMGN